MIKGNLKKRIFTSAALLFLLALIFYNDFVLVLSFLIIGSLSSIEFINLIRRIFTNFFLKSITSIIFIIYIFLFCFYFLYFSSLIQFKILIFILLVGCIVSDVAAYFSGRLLKGPKLSKISPKKTVSGALGSIIFTTLFVSFSFTYFFNFFNINYLFIGLITSITCQIGDLFFSLLKRKASLKDTGNFLPGHGGLLDRIDGILIGLPLSLVSILIIF
tara:strand:- start:1039 stop:1689 length:651 start_codon:yes stop_codon:yes gene_type:complete